MLIFFSIACEIIKQGFQFSIGLGVVYDLIKSKYYNTELSRGWKKLFFFFISVTPYYLRCMIYQWIRHICRTLAHRICTSYSNGIAVTVQRNYSDATPDRHHHYSHLAANYRVTDSRFFNTRIWGLYATAELILCLGTGNLLRVITLLRAHTLLRCSNSVLWSSSAVVATVITIQICFIKG